MFEIEGFDHVALLVRDVAASAAWYQDTFGLERRFQAEWGDEPLVLCAGDVCLALFQASEGAPTKGPHHLAFRLSGEAFRQAERDLRAAGVEHRVADHGIAHSIYLKDPDGHAVELTTYLT